MYCVTGENNRFNVCDNKGTVLAQLAYDPAMRTLSRVIVYTRDSSKQRDILILTQLAQSTLREFAHSPLLVGQELDRMFDHTRIQPTVSQTEAIQSLKRHGTFVSV